MANQRITDHDIQVVFKRLVGQAEHIGMDTSKWGLHGGSAPNGVSYKLLADGGNVFATNGYLGMTKREAYDALHHYVQALEAVVFLAERNGPLTIHGWS